MTDEEEKVLRDEVQSLRARVAEHDRMLRCAMAMIAELHGLDGSNNGLKSKTVALVGSVLRPAMLLVPDDVCGAMIARGVTPLEALALLANAMPRFGRVVRSAMEFAKFTRSDVTWTDLGLTLASRMKDGA